MICAKCNKTCIEIIAEYLVHMYSESSENRGGLLQQYYFGIIFFRYCLYYSKTKQLNKHINKKLISTSLYYHFLPIFTIPRNGEQKRHKESPRNCGGVILLLFLLVFVCAVRGYGLFNRIRSLQLDLFRCF